MQEHELIDFGGQFGNRIIGLLERTLLLVYRRHREHVWVEHAINHVEEALEESGLQPRVPQPPAICFVDLTGFTQLTEQRGDEAAAQVAGRLPALVNEISRSRGGRPIRWLGDGGCSTSGSPRGRWSPGWTWSKVPPRPAYHRPMWASTPARWSPRMATCMGGLST